MKCLGMWTERQCLRGAKSKSSQIRHRGPCHHCSETMVLPTKFQGNKISGKYRNMQPMIANTNFQEQSVTIGCNLQLMLAHKSVYDLVIVYKV